MTAYDLARGIYEHHRRSRLKAPRRQSPVPRWEELTLRERKQRTEAARRLLAAYARPDAREVSVTA